MSGPETVARALWRQTILAIEAEARAAAVAPLEKALREFLDTVSAAEALGWTWAGTKSMKAHHPITGDLYTAHARLAALLSAPSPVREPERLDVERLAQALSCWSAPISGEGDPEFVAWAAQMIRSYLSSGRP